MSESKVEKYRLACEAMKEARPANLVLPDGKVVGTGEAGETVWMGSWELPMDYARQILSWLLNNIEPPQDAAERVTDQRPAPEDTREASVYVPHLTSEYIHEWLKGVSCSGERGMVDWAEAIIRNAYHDGFHEALRQIRNEKRTPTEAEKAPEPEVPEMGEASAADMVRAMPGEFVSVEFRAVVEVARRAYRAGALEMNRRWREREGKHVA